jgi:NIPSNAP
MFAADDLCIFNPCENVLCLIFVCGAVVMLCSSALSGSNPSHHVYELRLYHVHEGKMDALKARFGDHTNAIFKRHNMKSVGYWVAEDAPSSQNLFIYILEHPQPAGSGEELGCVQSRSRMAESEDTNRSKRATGRSGRQLFHGSDQLFGTSISASRSGAVSRLSGAPGHENDDRR